MPWFDTPDSWWDKDKIGETDNSYKLETWDLNRDNVPEEYHWPDRLRASFTIRVYSSLAELAFRVRNNVYFFGNNIVLFSYTGEISECYSVIGDLHEFICVNVELPITYSEDLVYPVDFSLYPSFKYRLRIMAEAGAYGDDTDSHMTEAEIHNIQFFGELPSSHSVFWHKFVNTYET